MYTHPVRKEYNGCTHILYVQSTMDVHTSCTYRVQWMYIHPVRTEYNGCTHNLHMQGIEEVRTHTSVHKSLLLTSYHSKVIRIQENQRRLLLQHIPSCMGCRRYASIVSRSTGNLMYRVQFEDKQR